MGIDNWVKVVVVACFFINSIYSKGGTVRGKRDQVLLIFAMAFTLIADIFMVLLGMNAVGVLAFCIVQALHNYRFTNKGRLITQIALGSITIVVALLSGFNLLFALGGAYAVFLFFSVSGAFMAYPKYPAPNNLMIVLGMLLFMGCDIFVAIYYLGVDMDPEVREFAFRAIWFCYFPSQALLSSSARRAKKHEDDE